MKRIIPTLVFLLLPAVFAACGSSTPAAAPGPTATSAPATAPTPQPQGMLTIFHAGSLSVPFKHIAEEFNRLYPGIAVEMESAGSRTTIRKVTELGRKADIVGSADYVAIEQLMFPDFADWHVRFATNRMVIAYTDDSRYADEINGENWYEVLTRDGVEYGHSSPDADPCGYRTLLVFQLAEQHTRIPGLAEKLDASCPEKNVRPKSVELIALLQSGDLDYAFEYQSVAVQHGLRFVELPVEVDLSSVEHADLYAGASVEIAGKEPGATQTQMGAPIVYGVTVPTNAPRPDLAVIWIEFLLGAQGRAILQDDGQPPIVPALARNAHNVPGELRALVRE